MTAKRRCSIELPNLSDVRHRSCLVHWRGVRSGVVRLSKGNDQYKTDCWRCEGTGTKEDGKQCTHCAGRGQVQFAYPGRGMVGRNGTGEKDGDVRPNKTGELHHS